MRVFLHAALGLVLTWLGGDAGPRPAPVPRPGAGSERGGAAVRIAVIPKGTTHEFWKSIHAGARTAARELGVEVVWKGPIREDDRAEQIKIVEAFKAQRISGIVLAPLDRKALVAPVKEAMAAGVPVIIADSDLDWDGPVSYVATDNQRGGVLAAEALAGLLKHEGKVLLLRYMEGSASTALREAGFLETLAARFPKIQVVSSNQHAGATKEGALAKSETLLKSFPDVQGIFCPNESAAFGMLRALQGAGKAGKVRFIGFDASTKLVEGLVAGEIDGLVVQNPFAMGEVGIRAMVDHLAGKPVEKRIDTGVTMVTRDTMNDPAVARLLKPDLSILGG